MNGGKVALQGERNDSGMDNPALPPEAERQTVLANAIADARDADVLIFNADIDYSSFFELVEKVRSRKSRRKNVVVILVTGGGDPDAAYKIARYLRMNYDGFELLVPGFCKSSGTLIAVAADSITMADYGELGPLDIQIPKHDDVGTRDSGLTATTALDVLRNESYATFEMVFLKIKARSRGQISFKTATEIASALTVGLFQPISAQVQAMHLGEVERASRITEYYGKRLASQNVKEDAIENLANSYPSHGFVIDREEASRFFRKVEKPTQEEIELFDLLGEAAIACVHDAAGDHISVIGYLSVEVQKENEKDELRQQRNGENSASTNDGERSEVRDSSAGARPNGPTAELPA